MSLFTERVDIEYAPELTDDFDKYGQPITLPARTKPDVPAWFEPRSSSEDVAAKDQQVDGYWLYLPLSEDLTTAERVRVYGGWYEVEGEPGVQPGGFIVEGFVKAALTRWRG